jgi:hypothetical protein
LKYLKLFIIRNYSLIKIQPGYELLIKMYGENMLVDHRSGFAGGWMDGWMDGWE